MDKQDNDDKTSNQDQDQEKIIGMLEISIKAERQTKTFSEWSINLTFLVIGLWLGHFFTLSVDVKCNPQTKTQTQTQTEKGNSNASDYSNQYPRL